jgi:hypothetical protein
MLHRLVVLASISTWTVLATMVCKKHARQTGKYRLDGGGPRSNDSPQNVDAFEACPSLQPAPLSSSSHLSRPALERIAIATPVYPKHYHPLKPGPPSKILSMTQDIIFFTAVILFVASMDAYIVWDHQNTLRVLFTIVLDFIVLMGYHTARDTINGTDIDATPQDESLEKSSEFA